jgi:predicted DNA binding CopG/RHH family protein
MTGKDRQIDPLPEEFASEDEAAEFWETHSLTDYEESLQPVDFEADIQRRHFEIEVDEESFAALCRTAQKQNKPVKDLASEILKRNLDAA